LEIFKWSPPDTWTPLDNEVEATKYLLPNNQLLNTSNPKLINPNA